MVPQPPAEAALHLRQRLLPVERAPRVRRRPYRRCRRDLRLHRDHATILQPLPAAGDAHRDQPVGRPARRRSGQMAVEGMGQRPAPAQRRHPDRRLHLVQPDRPGRLGHRASRAERQRQSARAVRPRPQDPQRRQGLQAADRRLAQRASGAERVPDRSDQEDRGDDDEDDAAGRASAAAAPRRKAASNDADDGSEAQG